jgi:hypothetical protein
MAHIEQDISDRGAAMPNMTPDQMRAFLDNASKYWSITKRINYDRGEFVPGLADVRAERARLSRIWRQVAAPGSPAGASLMNDCLTACMGGWNALASYQRGVRPAPLGQVDSSEQWVYV